MHFKTAWKTDEWILLHQDNAPAHKSVFSMAAVRECGFELVDQPKYFPDLAPSDYFLFPKMKNPTWLGIEALSTDDVVICICIEDVFEDEDESFYNYRNPSAATQMEKVCGPQ